MARWPTREGGATVAAEGEPKSGGARVAVRQPRCDARSTCATLCCWRTRHWQPCCRRSCVEMLMAGGFKWRVMLLMAGGNDCWPVPWSRELVWMCGCFWFESSAWLLTGSLAVGQQLSLIYKKNLWKIWFSKFWA